MSKLSPPPVNEPLMTKQGISRAWVRWFDETKKKLAIDGEVIGSSDIQTLTNKILTTPTIGDLSNVGHDHEDDAGGGKLDHGDALDGLASDDHAQYHNDARGDIRYLYKENTTVFTPDGNYEPATKKYVDDKKAATQSDAAALTAITAGAGEDTIDLSTFNTDLGTLVTEINAIKDVVNALIDKLQAAGLMT